MIFSEDDFSTASAAAWRQQIAAAGLGCLAISAHMDNGVPEAPQRLERRLHFAAELGARFVITNTARQDRREDFLRTVATVLPMAEAAGVALAFENPGHGEHDLLRRAAAAAPLLAAIGSPWAVLNYDVGNVLTNSEGALRPEADLAVALPLARHLHLKDMALHDGTWRYAALGAGNLDYATILAQVAAHPMLPVCVELPLCQIRRAGVAPVRAPQAPPLATVRDMLAASLQLIRITGTLRLT